MTTPTLNLDFTSGTLDPLVSFARADATATVVNSSGEIAMVNADTPRFDYNLNTGGACKGLLVEDQRTNLLTYSNPNAATPTGWSIGFNTGTYTRTLVACTFVPFAFSHNAIDHNVSSGRSYMFKTFSVVIGEQYTITLFIDTTNSTASGPILSLPFGGVLQRSVSDADSSGKITGTFTATGSTVEVRLGVGVAAEAVGRVIFTAWQMEQANSATSYIPTAGSAVTRNADVATITGADFSGFWQAGNGGLLARAQPGTVSGTRPWVQVDDNTADEIIALRGNTTNPELVIVAGGTPQATLDAGTIAANTVYDLNTSWNSNDCRARLDSGAMVSALLATIPTVTQMRIGSDGTNYLNGHLETINYFDQIYMPGSSFLPTVFI